MRSSIGVFAAARRESKQINADFGVNVSSSSNGED